MKVTKSQLKQIILEELEVVLTNEEVEEMFGEEVRKEVEEGLFGGELDVSMKKSPQRGKVHSNTSREEERLQRFLDSVTANIENEKQKRSITNKIIAFLNAEKEQLKKDFMIPEQENNPWAICTASVGREDKEKYEKCVKSVKRRNKK